MQINRLFIFIVLCASFSAVFSQDVLYLNNGTKFTGLVKEINITEIKYKNENNPNGPTYVIAKSDVLFIEYKNGTIDVINKNPRSLSPIKEVKEPVAVKKEEPKPATDINYINKNVIMINGIALANADLTLLYDREFANSRLSATALVGYNFNNVVTWPNLFVANLPNAKKNYDIGLGVNYYTSNRRKTQYFVGVLIKYMYFSYDKTVQGPDQIINGFPFPGASTTKRASDYQLAPMIVNGFQIRVSPTINY
ncbi:MAG: hypothetical protein ACXVPD_10825, partial [Bacteroidia bacterium]